MESQTDNAKIIFLAALEIASEEERRAYLSAHCGADELLRREVEELLQVQASLGSFLESSSPDLGATPLPVGEQPGDQIGPYRLLDLIGEGGFGLVYLAQQREPIERHVALKIIKPGMDSREVVARFEAERQALAHMDHPNIATVLDAGTTDLGRPYFVMEYVNGDPITRYCDEQRFSCQQRLELFICVCEAIQHAHQKGIIHRDIKPSNVLVGLNTDRPMPKVIDFGVAKAIRQPLVDTAFTQLGQIVGTLEYMSPEQAQSNHVDIDTRSDVYSLGVLLYELLIGVPPLDRQRMRSGAFDEIMRMIREEERPTPSSRLRMEESLASIAASRRTEPKQLKTLVRGELDWIVTKALNIDRRRRYETVSALSDDIRRHLSDEPVLACPPSATYRLTKFVRRNRPALATATAIVFALVVGLALAANQAVRARKAEQTARASAETERMLRSESERSRERAEKIAADARSLFYEMFLQLLQTTAADEGVRTDIAMNLGDFEALGMSSALCLLHRGRIYLELTQYESAINDLDRCITLEPGMAPPYRLRGYAYQMIGDLAMAETNYNDYLRLMAEGAAHGAFQTGDLELVLKDTLANGLSPFSLRRARVTFGAKGGATVWRPWCGNLTGDQVLLGGYQKPTGDRCFIAFGAAQIRGTMRSGFTLMNALPHDSPLVADWSLELRRGAVLQLQWALTDRAVRMSCTGVTFTVLAIDESGGKQTLVEQVLMQGDSTVYRGEYPLSNSIQRIQFVHDNRGDGFVDRLWVYPHLDYPKLQDGQTSAL